MTVAENGKVAKERTKIVLRHIPPAFTKESLLELLTTHCQPFPEYNYYYFSPPDYSLAPHCTCRAYFNFLDPASVIVFKNKFDGQPFKDCNKVQMTGMVEYSPFQRVPKRSKRDIREGTVEKDPDYIEFLETLKVEPDTPPNLETIVEEIEKRREQKKEEQSTTALLDFIKSRRESRSASPGNKGRYRGNNRISKYEDSRGSRSRGAHRGRQNSGEEKQPDEKSRTKTDRGRTTRSDASDARRAPTPDLESNTRGRDRYSRDKRSDKEVTEKYQKGKIDQQKQTPNNSTADSGERYKRKDEDGVKRSTDRKEEHSPSRRDEPRARNTTQPNPRPTSSKYKSLPEKAIYVPVRKKDEETEDDDRNDRRDNRSERETKPSRDNRPERDSRDNRDSRPRSRDCDNRSERGYNDERKHYRREDYSDYSRGDRAERSDRYTDQDNEYYERPGRGYRGSRGGYGRYRGSNYRDDRGRGGGRSRGRGRGRD